MYQPPCFSLNENGKKRCIKGTIVTKINKQTNPRTTARHEKRKNLFQEYKKKINLQMFNLQTS